MGPGVYMSHAFIQINTVCLISIVVTATVIKIFLLFKPMILFLLIYFNCFVGIFIIGSVI